MEQHRPEVDDPGRTLAYRAVCLQVTTRAINTLSVPAAREAIDASITSIAQRVRGALGWIGPDCRLVVLPEYVLTGFPMGDAVPAWAAKAAIAPDGPEYERLGQIAAEHRIFLATNAYETDPAFPELYFQASVVLGPTGDVVLRYRRLHSLYSPSPYDVLDAYLDAYGSDGLFPVARTEIGTLAAVASEEILYPELSRTLAMRGAEVLLHSTSEITSPELTPKAVARRARAIENIAYVVSANSGGLTGIPIPSDSTNGGSEIVDFAGRRLAAAGPGESIVATAELDLTALRRERRRPGMANLPSRVKAQLWAGEYARHDLERPNLLAGSAPDRAVFARRQADVLDRLARAGVLG